uniref:Uncharacterized protein n=1 Tax=Arundo donax TaxID=35708 RepID=A0A0A8YTU7_ARUDO
MRLGRLVGSMRERASAQRPEQVVHAQGGNLANILGPMDAKKSPNTRRSNFDKHYQVLKSSTKHHLLPFGSVMGQEVKDKRNQKTPWPL